MLPNPTIAWLTSHCRSNPIDEKWLLVEHLRVGQQWKDRLTQAGCWHINLLAKTWRQLVNDLSAPWLTQTGQLPVGRSGLELLVERVVQDLNAQQQLVYFHQSAASHHALSRLLVRTYNDWRLADLSVAELSGQCLEVPAKAVDLSLIFCTIRERLAATNQADYADCIAVTIASLKSQQLLLPRNLLILQPESFPLPKLERDLLEAVREAGARWHEPELIPEQSTAEPTTIKISKQVAIGEINEVRGVFQHAFASQKTPTPTPLDHIEVLVTDYQRYAPLVLEGLWQWLSSDASLSIEELPITLAEGIACIYSRPGRLLRSWIRWADSDYLQSKAIQIVREGLLARSTSAEHIGYARLANTLRQVPIGFGLERYLPQIAQDLDTARRQAKAKADDDPDFRGDYGSASLQGVLDTIAPLVTLAPKSNDSTAALLESARQLLMHHARAESVIDRYARAKLVEDIDGMMAAIRSHSDALTNVRAWLEELPTQSRLLASTPRPGCVHVAPLEQGGAGGRPRVYILGMDDRKFPRKQTVDPILLDGERTRISPDLVTSDKITDHQQAALDRLWQRLRGVENAHVVCSHSLLNLDDDSECFASPILSRLEFSPAGNVVAFVADREQHPLTATEAFHRELLLEPDRVTRWQQLGEHFPRVQLAQQALVQQMDTDYTAYDGWVPEAGADLLSSATTHPMSPSRLEMLGTCPRKYFFARALGIAPPGQWNIDEHRWLSALEVGNLLHEMFEQFLRELQITEQIPDPSLHTKRLTELLEAKIAEHVQRVPVHNPEAFKRQHDELLDYCEIFLQKEHQYALKRGAKTWIMEASLGSFTHRQQHATTEIDSEEPIVVELSHERKLHLCGRIDRIDRLGEATAPRHVIWDYKTGSDFGFDQANAIQQGRKLQPLLYTRMLAARFAQLGLNPDSIDGFGYFFPSPRCEGLRYEWTASELQAGDPVLESLLDLLSSGTFIATNNKTDCGYCDYQSVCGPAEELVRISNLKSSDPDNEQLEAWRKLRE